MVDPVRSPRCDGDMDTNDKHPGPPRPHTTVTALLDEMAEHADEAALGDLRLYLRAASLELALGPWRRENSEPADPAESASGVVRRPLTEQFVRLLALLEELRLATADDTAHEAGLVAVAAARMFVADGIRHLDTVAEKVARDVSAALAQPRPQFGRVDWRWAS